MTKLLLTKNEHTFTNIVNQKNIETLPENLPINFIINNKISYLLYKRIQKELESKFNQNELKQIHKKVKNIEFSIKEVHKISKIFKKQNIDSVFLFKAIESQCDSTDIDVVIKKHQIEDVINILMSLNYISSPWGGEKKVYTKTQKDGSAIQIDIESENESNCIFTERKIDFFNNKKQISDINVPSSNDELNSLILRQTLNQRPITLCYILHIANVLKNCDINALQYIKKSWHIPFFHFIYLINTIYKELYSKEIKSPLTNIANEIHHSSWILKFFTKIETKKITLPFKSNCFIGFCFLYKLLYDITHLNPREIIKDFLSIINYYILFLFMPIQTLFRCSKKKRIFVCFSGIDGTGKTMHAEKIIERFKSMGIPSQYVWCNWVPRISYPIMGFIYLITGGYRRKDYYKSKLLRKIWNYIIIFDYIYIYLFKIKIPLLLSKNVVCDRYIYDAIADLVYDKLYNKRASKILLKIIPKPDLVFMLDISEGISDLRKNDTKNSVNIKDRDNAINYLKIHRDTYSKIAKTLNIPLIDTTKDFDDLNNDIYEEILDVYRVKNNEKV